MQFSGQERRTAFSVWLRTGRWPRAEAVRNVEVKFNPWHDARDGRFTFAGAGGYFAAGGTQATNRRKQDVPPYVGDPTQPVISNTEEIYAWAARERSKYINHPNHLAHFKRIAQRVEELKRDLAKAAADKPNIDKPGTSNPEQDNSEAGESGTEKPKPNGSGKTGGFLDGLGEGLYDSGKEAVTGLYTLVTTNPLTTVTNLGRGLAGAFDTAIEAEDTPAYVQFNRAVNSVTNASAHDWGYGLGKTGGNAVLALAPGVAAARISTIVRAGRVEAVILPKGRPKVIWVDETPTFKGREKVRAKAYNDSARGARSNILTKKGQAPALERTMPDGKKRRVKFDGVDHDHVYGYVMIDRKWSVTMRPKVKDQARRQSEILAQHDLIGIWEVPSKYQQSRAIKIMRELGITNIKIRVVKP
jgi:hypothetical protein